MHLLKFIVFYSLIFISPFKLIGQTIEANLKMATKTFEQLSLLKGAIYSLYVVDAKTGNVIFAKNEQVGLATASCLKVLTSISALDAFGPNHTFKTTFSLLPNNVIAIEPSGDPTLGSWRYKISKPDTIIKMAIKALQLNKTTAYSVKINDNLLGLDKIAGASIWEDIGSYYGAVSSAFNWYENQTDAMFKTSTIGAATIFESTKPKCTALQFINETKTGAKGTGDNSLTYFMPNSNKRIIKGTLENEKNLIAVGVSVPSAPQYFIDFLQGFLPKASLSGDNIFKPDVAKDAKTFTHFSPNIAQIVYWFNKKSINLYGDALLRTLGKKLGTDGSFEKSADALVKFWDGKKVGIEPFELKLFDGSGLSPQTRVTTRALVNAMQYAYKQPWFSSFYESLPEYNGMKLKSGTINGTKGFTGMHASKDGNTYFVSMIINNYNGNSSEAVDAMYTVLNTLK